MKYQAIRLEIKTLADQQLGMKAQRKTTNFKGVRVMEPYQATNIHERNRFKLRHLYMAYANLRGVERPVPTKSEYDPEITKAYVEKFTVIVEEKQAS
jgi:hypothetical protein